MSLGCQPGASGTVFAPREDLTRMSEREIVPPGQHPCDPSKKEIDPIGFALERVQTFLTWIEEHRASFEKDRRSDPASAEVELGHLAHATQEAVRHFVRLAELLLAGYTLDPTKRLPKSLFQPEWRAWAERFLDQPGNEDLQGKEESP